MDQNSKTQLIRFSRRNCSKLQSLLQNVIALFLSLSSYILTSHKKRDKEKDERMVDVEGACKEEDFMILSIGWVGFIVYMGRFYCLYRQDHSFFQYVKQILKYSIAYNSSINFHVNMSNCFLISIWYLNYAALHFLSP